MLEVRYNTNTKEVTGWWSSRFGKHDIKLKDRQDEAIIELDIPVPEKGLDAYLYDEANEELIDNPDYVEPEPVFSFQTFTHGLPDRVARIEEFLKEVYP